METRHTLPATVLQHGSEEPAPERRELRAGPLTMLFEPETAFLSYIRLGDREVLRGIYAAVRGHNWDTIRPRASNVVKDISQDAFRVTFDTFPHFLSPHQPFKDPRAVSHAVVPGVVAEVRMQGDTFEMEDGGRCVTCAAA